jgi:hypothetical protein
MSFHSFLKYLTLCGLLSVFDSTHAQHNVYINQAGRTRIIHQVGNIALGQDSVTVRSDNTDYTFGVATVSSMSLTEKDLWRAKVLPERYLPDFDFDIAFEEEDKKKVKVEYPRDNTDEDFVAHNSWTKKVGIVYDEADVTVSGDTDSLTVKKEGAHLTIETAATGVKYIISGCSTNASFKLYSEK